MKKQYYEYELFQEQLNRLFPNNVVSLNERGLNRYGVKDITIQVTEDCNLRCTYCY